MQTLCSVLQTLIAIIIDTPFKGDSNKKTNIMQFRDCKIGENMAVSLQHNLRTLRINGK